MNTVFRVDASISAGSGHVMRCLTLADELRSKGIKSEFICKEHPGHLIDYINQRGYGTHLLPVKLDLPGVSMSNNACLGGSVQSDAQETCSIIEGRIIDWLIVDHYAIDKEWESIVKPKVLQILIIDDLSDREHLCDLLLDKTFMRSAEDYKALTSADCSFLMGTGYALLRPQFKALRTQSLIRRKSKCTNNILLFLGGSDAANISLDILEALNHSEFSKHAKVTLVLGSQSTLKDCIQETVSRLSFAVEVLIDVDNMAQLMCNADLAIGAAGSSTWERACLALPTVQLCIAENQKKISDVLKKHKAAVTIHSPLQLVEGLDLIYRNHRKLSLLSASLVDGEGANRVVNAMFNNIESMRELRPVAAQDCDFLLELQKQTGVRRYSRNPQVPSSKEHRIWFDELFNSALDVCYVISESGHSCGMIRLQFDKGEAQVSVIVQPESTGRGLATFAVKKLTEIAIGEVLVAWVHRENTASYKLFSNCGFSLSEKQGEFLRMIQ